MVLTYRRAAKPVFYPYLLAGNHFLGLKTRAKAAALLVRGGAQRFGLKTLAARGRVKLSEFAVRAALDRVWQTCQ
jgi:hypothetical protein